MEEGVVPLIVRTLRQMIPLLFQINVQQKMVGQAFAAQRLGKSVKI